MKRTPGKEIPMYNDDYDYPDMIECEVVDFIEDCSDEHFKNVEAKKDYGYDQYEEPFKNFDLYGLFYRKPRYDDDENRYDDLISKYEDKKGSCSCGTEREELCSKYDHAKNTYNDTYDDYMKSVCSDEMYQCWKDGVGWGFKRPDGSNIEDEADKFAMNKVKIDLENKDDISGTHSSITEYVMDLIRNRMFI